MTRKDELVERARSLVLKINEIQPEQWDATDQRDCVLICSALRRVEREVWEKAAKHVTTWCREQAKEVA